MDNEFEDQQKLWYAYFSETQAREYGSVFYGTPDGGEVEVTAVVRAGLPHSMGFSDIQYRGVVTKWLRDGRQPDNKRTANFATVTQKNKQTILRILGWEQDRLKSIGIQPDWPSASDLREAIEAVEAIEVSKT